MARTTRSKDTTPVPQAQPNTGNAPARRGRGRPASSEVDQNNMPAASRSKAGGKQARSRPQQELTAIPEIDPGLVKYSHLENEAENILDAHFEQLSSQTDVLFGVLKLDDASNTTYKSLGKLTVAYQYLLNAANEFKYEGSLFIDSNVTLSHLTSAATDTVKMPTDQCLHEVFVKANLALLVAKLFMLEQNANGDSSQLWEAVDDGFFRFFSAPKGTSKDQERIGLYNLAVDARAQLAKEKILTTARTYGHGMITTQQVEDILESVFFKNAVNTSVRDLLSDTETNFFRGWKTASVDWPGNLTDEDMISRIRDHCNFLLSASQNVETFIQDITDAMHEAGFLNSLGAFLKPYLAAIDTAIAEDGGLDGVVGRIIELKRQHLQQRGTLNIEPPTFTSEAFAHIQDMQNIFTADSALNATQAAPVQANMSSMNPDIEQDFPTQDHGFGGGDKSAASRKRARNDGEEEDDDEQQDRDAKVRRRQQSEEAYEPPPENEEDQHEMIDSSAEGLSYDDIHQRGRQASQAYHSKRQVSKPPQRRTAWTSTESSFLIEYIGKHGASYSLIKSEDMKHLNKLHLRDQNSLRDKARNIKFDYLKAKATLPPNFNNVQLKKTQIELLQNMGIAYHQDRLRAK